ncbi:MAG: hypothetical protein GY829_12880 [Gammaproteobacteria bacterium]|nr:hypothetical protein [Gammaproteobacteria bacterium]
MKLIIKLLLVVGCSFYVTACFGPPAKTEYYEETVGPNVSGCFNQNSAVMDEQNCVDFRVGDVVVELMPRGTKAYYQDPEKSPYKLPALVCSVQRGAGFDFVKNFRVDKMVVTTNTDKTFSDFKMGFVNYSENCKYIALTPRVDINVQEETEIHVKMLVTVLSPEVITKEMNFVFEGKSKWYLPFYGP